MDHRHPPERYGRYGRLNKKKLAIALLLAAVAAIVILALLADVATVVIKALIGQADSGIGQSIADIIQTLWGYVMDFVRALWRQVIANPLQFLIGGN